MNHIVANHLAREDIRAALDETQYLRDPMEAGAVANIRQRLGYALRCLDEAAADLNTGDR